MKSIAGHAVRGVFGALCFGAMTSPGVAGAQTTSVIKTEVTSPGSIVSSTSLASAPTGSNGFSLRYRSVSVAGKSIEVTGVAFVPNRPAPPTGWPVLSFAHGTSGLADQCAPSGHISQVETILAATFNALGIAVVQSDYEGLGTEGRHPYLVGVSEGRGVIDAVRALRNVPGQNIGNRYVVWGHSQGGHAALFAGQIAATWAPELKLLDRKSVV